MQSEKMCVVLLFGGMSSEHEVSRVSVGNFVNNIDREKYEVLTVGITKEGRWLYTEATAAQMADGSWEELAGNMACVISPDRADHGMILFAPEGHVEKVHVDVVIPVLHGLWGEDGTVQGLLELAGIPYVGCGVLASAVCMDKAVANALFEANGVPHTRWLAADRWEIESDLEGVCEGVEKKLGWPVFVKPANAGSSVGISKVSSRDELKKAIDLALENDRKVVFEAFVDGQEVECAVIGSDPGITAAFNGGTHMPFEDMALYRAIPGAVVVDATDVPMLVSFLEMAKDLPGVKYIRVGRKNSCQVYEDGTTFEVGKGAVLREGTDAVIVACGIMVHEALQAAKQLAEEGIDVAVIDPVTVKPLDCQLIRTYAAKTGVLVTAENHNKIGGLYSAVKECLDGEAKVGYVAVEDTFGEVGPQDYLRTRFDLTDSHIVRVVKETMKKAGKSPA